MKRIFYALVFSLPVFVSLPLGAEVGFFRPGDRPVPKAVAQASESVYNVFHFARDLEIKTQTISQDRYQESQQNYEAILRDSTNQIEITNNYYHLVQLLRCMKRRLEECTIKKVERVRSGTAFLYGAKNKLITASHVLLKRGSNELKDHVIIVDQHYQILFDTLDHPEDQVNILINGRNLERALQVAQSIHWENMGNFVADFLVIEVNKDLPGEPLVKAKITVDYGERIYMAGYPIKTIRRDARFTPFDSPGHGLRVSLGERTTYFMETTEEGRDDYKTFNEDQRQSLSLLDDYLMVGVVDSVAGMSGSPFLNRNGEVVGLFSGNMVWDESLGGNDDIYVCFDCSFGVRISMLENLINGR